MWCYQPSITLFTKVRLNDNSTSNYTYSSTKGTWGLVNPIGYPHFLVIFTLAIIGLNNQSFKKCFSLKTYLKRFYFMMYSTLQTFIWSPSFLEIMTSKYQFLKSRKNSKRFSHNLSQIYNKHYRKWFIIFEKSVFELL